MDNNKGFYGWKLVAVLWVLNLINMGLPLYGGTVISSLMLQEITMDRSTYGLAFSLMNLFIGISSIFVSTTIQKWGIRATLVLGSGLVLLGTGYMALFATLPWHFMLGVGVLIGIGMGFSTVAPISASVSRWFTRKRGRAMSIVLTAPAISGLAFAPLVNWLIGTVGMSWRQAWLGVGAAMLISAVVAFLFVKEKPSDLGQQPDGGIQPAASAPSGSALFTLQEWSTRNVYRTPVFWLILIAACVTQYPFFFFTSQWLLAVRNVGFSAEVAAFSVAVFTIMSIPARLLAGFLMDKIAARYVFILGFFCYIAAQLISLTLSSGGSALVYLAAVFNALGFGVSYVAMQTVTAHYFGPRIFPRLNGIILLAAGVVGVPAPIVSGMLFDQFGSYNPAFQLNIGVVVVGILAALFIVMPRMSRVQEKPEANLKTQI